MKKYSVQHPVLKKYIKFFWEIESDYMEVNNKVIPVRNIDLKFNLNDTPHFLEKAGASSKITKQSGILRLHCSRSSRISWHLIF